MGYPPGHRSTSALNRRYCNACGRPRYRRGDCKARFHDIDHRHDSSRRNVKKAQAANGKLSPEARRARARRARMAQLEQQR
jgi:hypothetical protein